MVFKKLLGQFPNRGTIHKDIKDPQALICIERLQTASFRISSEIAAHKDLDTILRVIAQECLNCLKAHRCTIFSMDEKDEILKIQFTYALDPRDNEVGLVEEKEVAKKTLKQGEHFLLKESKDFSEFFKYGDRKRKITSLMSIPLFLRGKPIMTISLVLTNEGCTFDDKDFRFLSILGNQASIALENASLLYEVRKLIGLRETYEAYLAKILEKLQSLSEREQQRMDEHIGSLLSAKIDETIGKGHPVDGDIPLTRESGSETRQDQRMGEMVQVELADEFLGITANLSGTAAFIVTEKPMELGDQFIMKLHLSDGKEPIEVACKVIWTNRYGKESKHFGRGMGVKFFNLKEEAKKRIREEIKAHKFQVRGEITSEERR